ncbi:DNA sulfur modification protein DndB [Vibrio sp. JC009]|uniref:DNA sulfur modification protein DndB n=1 Tax=Vibrio sp. JC009 TaxID=2912314 RepID=UPI0023AEDC26|nr:DNA sulfur modification protein DndB [Vibrio sp. JC009]WED23047.1 DNA sulfur modification protein DndB [Vibrio sp. JC009]
MSTDGYFYRFPAAQGFQAGRCFYNISVPMRVLVKLLHIDGGNVLERSQRTVNDGRAKKVAQYINENQDSFIIPCLTGVVETPDGIELPEFIEVEETGVGSLKISMDCNIRLFDGQHRATGIAYALETNPDLASQTVPVMLFTKLSLAERKMAFADINQNVSKPAQSLSDAYNSRDPLPQLAIELSTSLSCFKGLVDFERNTITAKSEYLFPLKTIKDATADLLSLGKKPAAIEDGQVQFAKEFWTEISKAMNWGGLYYGDQTPGEIRESTIITHSVMVKAMGLAGKHLLAEKFDVSNIDFSGLQALDYSKSSSDFIGRCIQKETGRMIADATAIKLTAIKLLQAVGCTITPELKALEKQFFGDEESVLGFDNNYDRLQYILHKQFEMHPEYKEVFFSKEMQEELVDKVIAAADKLKMDITNPAINFNIQQFFWSIFSAEEPNRYINIRFIQAEMAAFKRLSSWLPKETTAA